MPDVYDTISDVRHGDEVTLPTISADEKLIILKVNEEDATVTLYNLTNSEALDALMGLVMALNG